MADILFFGPQFACAFLGILATGWALYISLKSPA
jgi:hypothetical protein